MGNSSRSLEVGTDFLLADQSLTDALAICGIFLAPQMPCSYPHLEPSWHCACILPSVSLRVCCRWIDDASIRPSMRCQLRVNARSFTSSMQRQLRVMMGATRPHLSG
jgi:hypothetical protein